MLVKRDKLERYASGKAPYLGLPLADDGTVVLRRDHLRLAAELANRFSAKITYDTEARELRITARGCDYKLRNLNADAQLPYLIRDSIERWARGRRRAKVTASEPEGPHVRKLRNAIAKLERQAKKIYLCKPENPACARGWGHADFEREQEATWCAEKPMRKRLARIQGRKLVHGEPTWRQFYLDVEAVIGHAVDSSRRHDRVCGRKHGPTHQGYLEQLPANIGMANKPHERGRDELCSPKRIECYQEARARYLERRRELAAVNAQIANFEQAIAEHGRLRAQANGADLEAAEESQAAGAGTDAEEDAEAESSAT